MSDSEQKKQKKAKKPQGCTPAAPTGGASSSGASTSASVSASWVQASAEVGLGGLTVTEAALAAMFNQLKEVEDPIFAVSRNCFLPYKFAEKVSRIVETVEKSSNVTTIYSIAVHRS